MKERLLTSPHEHTERLWRCWSVWIPDVWWILQSLFYKCGLSKLHLPEPSASQDIYKLLHAPAPPGSRYLPARMWGFAHVCSLRNAVFCSLPAICGFFFEVFSQTPFFLLSPRRYEKPNTSCFLALYWEALCCLSVSSVCDTIIKCGFGCVI